MADKIIRAKVTAPTYINGVLHLPGEFAAVDLNALGVDKLGESEVTDAAGNKVKVNLTPGLEAVGAGEDEEVVQVPVAAVAPHAPNAPNPQGIPAGTVQSGTGRLLVPDAENGAIEHVGADAPVLDKTGQSLTPDKPVKPSK
jgi:hypothetical protein